MNDISKKIIVGIVSIICIVIGVFFLLLCYANAGMVAAGSKYPEPIPMLPLILGIILIAIGAIVSLLYYIRCVKKKKRVT
jgi:membrane protein implicated in regulation of membrane protease activity